MRARPGLVFPIRQIMLFFTISRRHSRLPALSHHTLPLSHHPYLFRSLGSYIRTPTPQITTNQLRRALRRGYPTGIKQRGRRPIIFAEIEVHVRTWSALAKKPSIISEAKDIVLLTQGVRIAQASLGTKRIALRRAQIVHLDHNAGPRGTQRRIIIVRVR